MDEPMQANAYAEADFVDSDKAFIKDLENSLSNLDIELNSENCIIDIGCGPGNITNRIAMRWPNIEVIGIEGAKAMLSEAKKRQSTSFNHLLHLDYLLGNVSDLNRPSFELSNSAQLVVSNSLLHHLHDPNILWQSVQNLALPGAFIFHRDLRRPDTIKEALYLQKKHLQDASCIVKKDFLASLHAAFRISEVKTQLSVAGLSHLDVCEIGDRYLEVKGIL